MPLCWQSTDSWGRVARAEPRCESGERERMSEIKRANGGRGKNKNVRQQRRRRFFTGRMWNKGQEKMLKPTESVGESEACTCSAPALRPAARWRSLTCSWAPLLGTARHIQQTHAARILDWGWWWKKLHTPPRRAHTPVHTATSVRSFSAA